MMEDSDGKKRAGTRASRLSASGSEILGDADLEQEFNEIEDLFKGQLAENQELRSMVALLEASIKVATDEDTSGTVLSGKFMQLSAENKQLQKINQRLITNNERYQRFFTRIRALVVSFAETEFAEKPSAMRRAGQFEDEHSDTGVSDTKEIKEAKETKKEPQKIDPLAEMSIDHDHTPSRQVLAETEVETVAETTNLHEAASQVMPEAVASQVMPEAVASQVMPEAVASQVMPEAAASQAVGVAGESEGEQEGVKEAPKEAQASVAQQAKPQEGIEQAGEDFFSSENFKRAEKDASKNVHSWLHFDGEDPPPFKDKDVGGTSQDMDDDEFFKSLASPPQG